MSIFWGLVSVGIVGTVVFGVLLLFRPLTKKLFSKGWHYYSLLVPLFFLLGGTPLAGGIINQVRHHRMENNHAPSAPYAEAAQPHRPFHIPGSPESGSSAVGVFINEVTPTPEPPAPPLISERVLEHVGRNVAVVIIIWAVGAVIFLGMSIVKYLRCRRLVLHESRICNEADCLIPVVVSGAAHTPMLLGLLKPVIVLPDMPLSNAELRVVLAHELVHYKRKDLLMKMVALLANAAHWYNPSVYILCRQLNTYCELSCDEKVAGEMNAADRFFYGETILQVLQYSAMQRRLASNLMLATNLCNAKKNVKRRLLSMMNGHLQTPKTGV